MDNEKRLMLAIAVYAAIMVLIFHSIASDAQTIMPVVAAVPLSEERPPTPVVETEVVDFLIESADGRMMNAQLGLLAVEKSANVSIRDFGERIIKDHCVLLEKIKDLASERNISLPDQLSHKNIASHRNLSNDKPGKFDKSFVKIMIEETEHELEIFNNAIECQDPEVRSFAKRYLPLLESDLKKIKKIKLQMSY